MCPTQNSEGLANPIDYKLTADIYNNSLEKCIIKLIIFDHFPIFFLMQLTEKNKMFKIFKKVFNQRNRTSFKKQLSLLHWRCVDFNGNANEIYEKFLRTLTDIYYANFSTQEYILKSKDIKTPWIRKDLKKS